MTFLSTLIALTLTGPSAPDGPKRYSPLDMRDLHVAAEVLKTRVAYLQAQHPVPSGQPLLGGEVDGWALPIGPRTLVCQALLVKEATSIRIQGPEGWLEARIANIDLEARVAHLGTQALLSKVGLQPAVESPAEGIEVGMDLFALISTQPEAGVITGVMTEVGEDWLQENFRSDLRLRRGMPVFDAQLRWVGLARAVAWDKDPAILISPEIVRTSSRTRTAPKPPPDAASDRPWWAR